MNSYEEALEHLKSLLDNNAGFDKVSNAAYDLAQSIKELSDRERYDLRQIGAHAYDICEEIETLLSKIIVVKYPSRDHPWMQ